MNLSVLPNGRVLTEHGRTKGLVELCVLYPKWGVTDPMTSPGDAPAVVNASYFF